MGVQLSSIISRKEIELEYLANKTIAIDAYNTMYQFLSIIRDRLTGEPLKDSKGNVTSHLSGLFYRTINLLEVGIKPVFVFDGKPPEFKKATIERREKAKEEAEKKMEEAIKKGENVMKYAQASSRLDKSMVEEAKKLLRYMGIPYVQAPSEGEMQAAYMASKGDVWASASQDYDSLLVGSPRLIRNLSITGRRKIPNKQTYIEIKPELIELKKLLEELGITREQLIIIGIFVGTDYNPGIKGIGPKKALKLVKQEKTLENVMKKIEWDYEIPAENIYEFFLNPPHTDEYKLEWKNPDEDKLIEFMVKEHDFSLERIKNGIEKIKKSLSKRQQSTLSAWFNR